MSDAAITQLLELTRKRALDSAKALLESLPREKDKIFEHYVAELYRGNGWLSVVRGGRGDKSADILLYHPHNPDVVSWVVQCKNHARPLTYDDTRMELLKFEEKGTKERWPQETGPRLVIDYRVCDLLSLKTNKDGMLLRSWMVSERLVDARGARSLRRGFARWRSKSAR